MTEADEWQEFVSSLYDDEDGDSDSSCRYGEGPPVNPLAWPTPTLFPAELISVKALDHRSGAVRAVDGVLVRKTRNGPPDRAYLIRKKITRTTFGSVRMGVVLHRRDEDEPDVDEVPWISTEELIALKVSSFNRMRQLKGQQLESPLREVAALQLVGNHHPHVVGCYEVLQDAKHLYTIMPYYSQGTNLHGRLFAEQDQDGTGVPAPDENEARMIFRQLLKALLQLQRKGVFHRDISLDNLLISRTNQLRLIDLGYSLRVPYNDPCNDGCITDVSEGTERRLIKKQSKGGKLMYLAPEIIAEEEAIDGFAVDLWAAGVILFVLCVGLAPFKFADASDKRYAKISSGGLKSLMRNLKISLSSEACDLLQNMLREDPRHRLSLSEVMKHPWVMGEAPTESQSDNALLRVISGEVSVGGSVSSTEPTQDADHELFKAASNDDLSPKQDGLAVNPESRESASESGRDNGFVEAVHQVNQRLAKIGPKLRANAQQVAPRIMNAQRIGPKLKNRFASVPIPKPTSATGSSNLTPDGSPTTPRRKVSPTRSPFLSRLKPVKPNKAPPSPNTTTTA